MHSMSLNRRPDYLNQNTKGCGPLTNLNYLGGVDQAMMRRSIGPAHRAMEIPHPPYYVNFTQPAAHRDKMTYLAA